MFRKEPEKEKEKPKVSKPQKEEKEEKQGLFSFEVLRKGVEAFVDKKLNEDINESIK